jgi:hypothetical protein
MKEEYAAKKKAAEEKGEKLPELKCPKGPNSAGVNTECSDMGNCVPNKKGIGRCLCDKGFKGRKCEMSEKDQEDHKQAVKGALAAMKEKIKGGKGNNAKD